MKKIFTILFLLSIVQYASAQTGLKVGDKAPTFTGIDNQGQTVSLKKLLASHKYVVLFFYRGQWCPYCNKHIAQLQDSLQTLITKGAYVLGVTPETTDAIAKTVTKTKATSIPLVNDKGYSIMKAYQVNFVMDTTMVSKYKKFGVDLEANNGNTDHVLPVPATYVIDKTGKIKYVHFDKDYRKRASVSTIAAQLN